MKYISLKQVPAAIEPKCTTLT